jgi:acetate kinase
MIPLAPNHMPHEIAAIVAVRRRYRALPQVACFDTAFHRSMPRVAQMYALPRRYWDRGLVRFGFHGLSYEYIVSELRTLTGDEAAGGRAVIAHLGNGASMAAVLRGKGVDTTMGFTPAGGLVMSSRTGDLDPGVIVHLLDREGVEPKDLNDLINKESWLLGVSTTSSDMKDLLAREASDERAADAVNLFCYQAKKWVGAFAAVLGGLDTLVFTAGVGEHAPEIRRRICRDLEHLGIRIDARRNERNAPVISTEDGPVTVRVIPTDEHRMIARHTERLLREHPG